MYWHSGSGIKIPFWRLERAYSCGTTATMTVTELQNLLERVQAWPEEAQAELVAVANQIDDELRGRDYLATQDELRIIDAAMASVDAGQTATEAEIRSAFAKFRSV
jgi:hypothetical protein